LGLLRSLLCAGDSRRSRGQISRTWHGGPTPGRRHHAWPRPRRDAGMLQCRVVQSVAFKGDRPVADSAVTPYVFLDTEVFKGHHIDFQSPNIRRLVRLAVEGPVRLLLTTVTKGEVMDDLEVMAREAMKKIKAVQQERRVMRKVLPGDVMDAIKAVQREEAI